MHIFTQKAMQCSIFIRRNDKIPNLLSVHYKHITQSRQLCKQSWQFPINIHNNGWEVHRCLSALKAVWQTRCKSNPAQQGREGNAKYPWCTWLSAPGAQQQPLKTRVNRNCRMSCLYELFNKVRSVWGPLVSYHCKNQETLATISCTCRLLRQSLKFFDLHL